MDFLKTVALSVFDILLPERARAARTRKRSLHDFALSPTEHLLLGEKITTLLDYKDPNVSDLIRALKYEHSSHAAEICAQALADFLGEDIAAIRAFSPRRILLVPVPLHSARVKERGFNQMEKVLSKLPQDLRNGDLSYTELKAFKRIKPTPQQARLARAERLKNVADAFEADADTFKDAHVILVDDVTTTGATLSSAAKTLRATGARVTALAIARA